MNLFRYFLNGDDRKIAQTIFKELEAHFVDNGIALTIIKEKYAKIKRRFNAK